MRVAAAVRNDARNQQRNGFWVAAAFVGVIAAVVLSYLPASARPAILPVLIQGNLLIGTFFFLAGQMLLERGDGTLDALVVSPLRDGEYLASKFVTLGTLGVLEHLAIVRIGHGADFDVWLLCLGVLLSAAIYILVGFVAAAPYSSVNEYLMPSTVWILGLSVQFIHYAEMWSEQAWTQALWLHPLRGSLAVLEAAFRPVPRSEIVWGIVSSLVWSGVSLWWALRVFKARVRASDAVIR